MQIIVKNSYKHINRSFSNWDTPNGKMVKDKDHYDRLCKEQNMISYEQAEENSKRNKEGKKYILSREAQEIINESKKLKGKNGVINLKERPKLVEKMVKHGAIKDNSQYLKYLPKAYQPK